MKSIIDNLYERFQERFPATEPLPSQASPDTGTESDGTTEEPAVPEAPCRRTEHSKVGYDLDLHIEPGQILDAVGMLDEVGFTIDMITGVDWPDDGQMELVYDFLHFEAPARVAVRTRIPRDKPEIASLSAIFPGANWHERETSEFFGIHFTNHPNLIHLLLPEDFEGYPLRKDFKPEPDPS